MADERKTDAPRDERTPHYEKLKQARPQFVEHYEAAVIVGYDLAMDVVRRFELSSTSPERTRLAQALTQVMREYAAFGFLSGETLVQADQALAAAPAPRETSLRTECCDAPLLTDSRYCPKCGWEARSYTARYPTTNQRLIRRRLRNPQLTAKAAPSEMPNPWRLLAQARRVFDQDACGLCGQQPGSGERTCIECRTLRWLRELDAPHAAPPRED